MATHASKVAAKSSIGLAVGVASLLLLAAFLFQFYRTVESQPPPGAGPALSSTGRGAQVESSRLTEGVQSATDPKSLRDAVDQPAGGGDALPGRAVVRGQCAAPGSSSVPGCRVSLTSYPVDGALELRPEAEVLTDAEGRFECIASDLPGRSFRLVIAGQHRVIRSAMLGLLQPGQVVDLGVVNVFPGTVVRGKLLDRTGQPVARARILWQAADEPPRDSMERGFLESAAVQSDEQGQFSIARPLRSGLWDISLPDCGAIAWTPRSLLVEGEAQNCEIVVEFGPRIRGRVLDAAGRPIAGVQLRALDPVTGLTVSSLSQPTDRAGEFSLSPAAGYQPVGMVRVDLHDRSLGSHLLTDPALLAWDSAGVTLLAEPKRSLRLRVLDADSGEAVTGVMVCLRNDRALNWSPLASDPQGGLVVSHELEEELYLSVMVPSASHVPILWREVTLVRGSAIDLVILLQKAGSLQVRVVSAAGQPVVGAEVAVAASREATDRAGVLQARAGLEPGNILGYRGSGPWVMVRELTDANGNAAVKTLGVTAHSMFLRISAVGWATRIEEIQWNRSDQDSREITLVEAASLQGTLQVDGALAGLRVVLRPHGMTDASADHGVSPSRDGRFGFRDLEPGVWRLLLVAEDSGAVLGEWATTIHLGAGELQNLARWDFQGPLPSVLAGRFRVQGRIPEGAVVWLRGEKREYHGKVGAHGEWRVSGVLPGSYRVVCQWQDREYPVDEPVQVESGSAPRLVRDF